jgi:hypothetical protein
MTHLKSNNHADLQTELSQQHLVEMGHTIQSALHGIELGLCGYEAYDFQYQPRFPIGRV